MVWERIKRAFGRGGGGGSGGKGPQTPEIPWLEAADNPWGIRVLDVRPVTLNMLAGSKDEQCAVNAMSYRQDDGTSFIGQEPPVSRSAEASLRFPIDRVLADGVLFVPREMEDRKSVV